MNHHQAIYSIRQGWPGVAFTLSGLDFAGMTWGGAEPKPTEAEVLAVWATVDAQWNTEQQAIADALVADEQRVAAIKADALRQDMLAQLRTATPTQISTYVDNNVTDLASARTMLKRIILILAGFVRD